MVTPKLKNPLKWHGGKFYLAPKIIELMKSAPHTHYVEPYFGGGSVLLAKSPENVSEVVNDLNKSLINFWATLADDELFGRFKRFAEATPFAEQTWRSASESLEADSFDLLPHQRAWAFFVACRQSLAGRMKSFTGVTKTRTRRGMNNEVSAWLTAVEGLPAVHERLKRILILNRPALDVIRQNDGPETLYYLDPPYLHETRVTTSDYAHEMTAEQHAELLNALADIKGKFMLSGYQSELYARFAGEFNWTRHEFKIANHAAGGKAKKTMTECVWCNF